MARITLCADDYGLNPKICEGILKLVEMHRLTAVSCMTTTTCWLQQAQKLLPYQSQIDIGLHFNLSEGNSLSQPFSIINDNNQFIGLKKLLTKIYFRSIKQEEIEKELHQQLDKFIEKIGRFPDYIDGHHHIHHFPIIRNALLNIYEDRLRKHNSYIRIVNHRFKGNLLEIIHAATGAVALKKELTKRQIPFNPSFTGTYNFKKAKNYRKYFLNFLQKLEGEGLIVCHPGLTVKEDLIHSISSRRFYEFEYFKSDAFLDDCQRYQIELVRLMK